jgi:hypothetical protein
MWYTYSELLDMANITDHPCRRGVGLTIFTEPECFTFLEEKCCNLSAYNRSTHPDDNDYALSLACS